MNRSERLDIVRDYKQRGESRLENDTEYEKYNKGLIDGANFILDDSTLDTDIEERFETAKKWDTRCRRWSLKLHWAGPIQRFLHNRAEYYSGLIEVISAFKNPPPVYREGEIELAHEYNKYES